MSANLYHQSVSFTMCDDFTRMVSYCEELVEVTKGDDGFGLGESKIYHQLMDLNRKVVIK